MTPDFELDRKRKIVSMWRDGWCFDTICEHVGLGPDDVARVLFRVIRPLAFVDPLSRTMAEVMADEMRERMGRPSLAPRARTERAIALSRTKIEALLPDITTPGLRARLVSSLAAPLSSWDRQDNLGGAAQ